MPVTYVSDGADTMTDWGHNPVITLTNFENGSWKLIDDVPTNENLLPN